MRLMWLQSAGRLMPLAAFAIVSLACVAQAATPQQSLPETQLDVASCTDASLSPQRAVDSCSRLVDIDDLSRVDRLAVHLTRARGLNALGERDRAIADYDIVLVIDPDKVEALIERAALHRAKGDRRNALLDYTAALKLDPGLTEVRDARLELVRELERLGATMGLPPKR